MAQFDYDRIINIVARPQIQKFGTRIKLTRKQDDTPNWVQEYDPVMMQVQWVNKTNGEVRTTPPGEVVVEYFGSAVITRFKEQFYEGQTIENGDKKLLAIDIPQPQLDDVITIGNTDYKYVYHSVVGPSGKPVVFQVQVRV